MDKQKLMKLKEGTIATYINTQYDSSWSIMDATNKHITVRELKPPYEIKKISISYFDKYFIKK